MPSFAAKNAALIARVRAAREAGDARAERAALEELLEAYTRLGNREAGTVDEQNTYIVGRRLGALPEVLTELGVTAADLPLASPRRPSPPPASSPTHDIVAERFAHIGGPDDEEPPARFVVEHRPQDDKRYKGRLCPWAIVDTTDQLPVGWYYDRDFAELTADAVSRLRRPAA
ncbi:hypothetical protein ACPCAG_31230 [Streptomyces pseudogriseolus]|uniref:hypothetical protein n=1 Tax=Streptomyces pseudogriseolus TaxID=36817 RepID=UPI003FA276AB